VFVYYFVIGILLLFQLTLHKVTDKKLGHVSWFTDFIGQFSQATKPHPHKSADFIDRLTSP